MGYVLKRLALGMALIGLAAAVLLVFDWHHRRPVRPSGSAPAVSGKLPRVAIFQFASRQVLTLLMATWLKPQLLLLDEHTAALDPKTADQVIQLTKTIVAGERLTTLMVTHSMHQAVNLGDRLIMMHQGRVIRDITAVEKKHLRVEDLLEQFNEVRRAEQLDPGAAEMLKALYV